MEKFYKVQVTFPDGHTSEVEEVFMSKERAMYYGSNMIAQIAQTERFHKDHRDEAGFSKKIDPYFIVNEIDGDKSTLVYESKHKKRRKLFRKWW